MTTATADTEQESKDRFFESLADIAREMTAAHGKDFAMGALVLAARWLAENKSASFTEPRGH
jgi:predicted metallo-beta-lactamase superfamily hydrolase